MIVRGLKQKPNSTRAGSRTAQRKTRGRSIASRGGRDLLLGIADCAGTHYERRMRRRTSNRMPPVGTKHVVTVQAVARMLGWSTQRIRRIDDILRPTRAANGERLIDVDRALFFVRTMDILNSMPGPIVLDLTAEESRRIRREQREQWAR